MATIEPAIGVIKLIDKATTPIKSVISSLKSLGTISKSVIPSVDGTQKAINRLGRVNANIKRNTSNIQGQALATAGLVYSMKSILQPAIDFEQGMADVKAVMFGINPTSQEAISGMKALEEQARTLGGTTAYTATQVAEAQLYQGKAGFTAAQALKTIPPILNLASAASVDLATASDVVSDLLGSFGLKAEDTGKLVDIMAKATSGANVDVEGLFESLKLAAPIGKSLGQSVTDVTAAVSLLGSAGIKGSSAGTALRAMMSRLVKPAGDAQKVINKLGLKFVNLDGTMKPLPQILTEMDKKMGGLTQTKKAAALVTIFGQEALSAANILMDANKTGAITKFSKDLEDSAGVAAQMAKIRLDTLQGDMTNLGSATESLAISAGTFLSPALRIITSLITTITQDINAWADKNGDLVKTVGIVAGALVLFKVVALASTAAMWLMTPAISAVSAALKIFQVVMIVLNAVMSLNPLGLFIIGLAAVVAGVVLAYKHFDKFKEVVKSIGKTILSFFATPIEYVLNLLSKIPATFLPDGWSNSINEFKTTLATMKQPELPNVTVPKVADATAIQNIQADVNQSSPKVENNAIINVNVADGKAQTVTTEGDFKTKAFVNKGVQQ
jgi:TP901 family phage tail tape measure protein